MGAFLTSRCAIARGKRPDFQLLPRGIGPCAGTMRHGDGNGKQRGTIVSTVSSNIVALFGSNVQYSMGVSAGYSSAYSMDGAPPVADLPAKQNPGHLPRV
jgi:hypothetical protein